MQLLIAEHRIIASAAAAGVACFPPEAGHGGAAGVDLQRRPPASWCCAAWTRTGARLGGHRVMLAQKACRRDPRAVPREAATRWPARMESLVRAGVCAHDGAAAPALLRARMSAVGGSGPGAWWGPRPFLACVVRAKGQVHVCGSPVKRGLEVTRRGVRKRASHKNGFSCVAGAVLGRVLFTSRANSVQYCTRFGRFQVFSGCAPWTWAMRKALHQIGRDRYIRVRRVRIRRCRDMLAKRWCALP